MLQVPKGKDDKESNNVAKTVLLQRKEVLMGEVARLYPKMTGKKDFVIQMFEDPYADPVDMDQAIPEGMELVPAEIKWMKKRKEVPVLRRRAGVREPHGRKKTARRPRARAPLIDEILRAHTHG